MLDPTGFSDYAALCAVQGVLVAVPRRRLRTRPVPALALAPAAAMVAGVATIEWTGSGAVWLSVLALVATPALAAFAGWASGSRRPAAYALLVASAYAAAWWLGGAIEQVLQLGLVAAACVTLSALFAAAVPRGAAAGALVGLAAVDAAMVWGLADAGPAAAALHGVALPGAAMLAVPPSSPSLQDASLGAATMGWLDMFAPAALGAIVAGATRRRLAIALVVAVAGVGWGLLLTVTPVVPATVPVGLVVAVALVEHGQWSAKPSSRSSPASPRRSTPPPRCGRRTRSAV